MTIWGRVWEPARIYKAWERSLQGADLWELWTVLSHLDRWDLRGQPSSSGAPKSQEKNQIESLEWLHGRKDQEPWVFWLAWPHILHSLDHINPPSGPLLTSPSQPSSIYLRSRPYFPLFWTLPDYLSPINPMFGDCLESLVPLAHSLAFHCFGLFHTCWFFPLLPYQMIFSISQCCYSNKVRTSERSRLTRIV